MLRLLSIQAQHDVTDSLVQLGAEREANAHDIPRPHTQTVVEVPYDQVAHTENNTAHLCCPCNTYSKVSETYRH